ncbi:MAG: YicC family protein [Treponema sp.]|nr:YicC family protein [Treponema sp.]
MNSMTGYGFKEAVVDNTQISVEIKSVNSRFLDLSIYLPPFLNPLEARIRRLVSEKIVRGKVDLTIRVHDNNSTATVSADTAAAVAYRDAITEIARALGKTADDVPLSLIIAQEGVLNVSHQYDAEAYWQKIQGILSEVFTQFLADRSREGKNLEQDLLSKLDTLDSAAAFFKEWQPCMEEKFRETITKKFNELLGDHADENRIMQETAAMLVKYTINEEIIRLHSHLAALRKAFTGGDGEAPGKRIDFICQEANREINTIGSKNQFIEVGQKVIAAKDALENIREQAKNVE